MPRVWLDEGWQGGKAWIDVDTDVIAAGENVEAPALMIDVHTPLDIEGTLLELGVLRVEAEPERASMALSLAMPLDQARKLRDAITELLGEEGT